MALRAAASRLNAPLRQQAGRRTIAEGWISKPNSVIKEGEVFRANGHLHGADNPTYLKKSGDKGVFALGIGLTTFCTLQMIRGMDNMKFGTGKIE